MANDSAGVPITDGDTVILRARVLHVDVPGQPPEDAAFRIVGPAGESGPVVKCPAGFCQRDERDEE